MYAVHDGYFSVLEKIKHRQLVLSFRISIIAQQAYARVVSVCLSVTQSGVGLLKGSWIYIAPHAL